MGLFIVNQLFYWLILITKFMGFYTNEPMPIGSLVFLIFHINQLESF